MVEIEFPFHCVLPTHTHFTTISQHKFHVWYDFIKLILNSKYICDCTTNLIGRLKNANGSVNTIIYETLWLIWAENRFIQTTFYFNKKNAKNSLYFHTQMDMLTFSLSLEKTLLHSISHHSIANNNIFAYICFDKFQCAYFYCASCQVIFFPMILSHAKKHLIKITKDLVI